MMKGKGGGKAKGFGVQQPMWDKPQGKGGPWVGAPPGQTPCKFFAQGTCAKGASCPFSHGGAVGGGGKGGCCKGGFKGPAAPSFKGAAPGWKGEGKDGTPCKFFAMGTCAKGWECPFSHGPGGGGGGATFGKGFGKDSFGKGSFGKSKDKGKGKDGKGKGLMGKGHLLPRTRISEAPFSGTVNEWKGKYGWITPAETIEHEKAGKHGGRLFVGKDDLIGVEALEEGMTVEYHIWEDASGLGCEEVNVFE